MSWLMIVATIVAALMPIIKDWIDQILNEAALQLRRKDVPGIEQAEEGMRMVFRAAKARLWPWQWAKWRMLDRCEKMMVGKARQTWMAAAKNGAVPVLGKSDIEAVGEIPD